MKNHANSSIIEPQITYEVQIIYASSFLRLLGGIALFMYGMQLMGDGLQKAAGAKLQKILEAMTGVLAMGILLGAVVTAVLQASGATTVMTVGLVNAGLLTLKQGFGIIMGANIGTTMTAQLIAFKLSDYVTVLIFVGFLLQLLAKRRRWKYLGQVTLGFGILMLGMDMMGKSVMPLRHYPGFVDFINAFSDNPLLGILIGMVMTVIIQSSSATIGILIAMANQGLVPLEGAIPVLLGDNIGTCITAVLASLRANITAKRVAVAHVMFNVIGSIIFITFMHWFIQIVMYISPANDIARQIANAHSAFNIINTLLFMPFVNQFIKLVQKIVPGSTEGVSLRPVYLDKAMLNTPSIAMSLAVKEVIRMGNQARKDVQLGMEAIQKYDEQKIKYVLEHEPIVDALERDITDYLTEMSSTDMNSALSVRHTGLLHACNDIERIGDHGETLAKKARTIFEDDVHFSDEARAELVKLSEMVLHASGRALESLEKNDKAIADEAVQLCRDVKHYQKEIRKNHIVRLNEHKCDPVAGFVMLELLINMKRVSDHSKNIAQLVQGTF